MSERCSADELLERLKLDLGNSEVVSRGMHKVTFLENREAIEIANSAGFSRKSIWRMLVSENKLTCSYEMFNIYFTRYCSTKK